MVKVLIPGLDASFVKDANGASFWQVNKDWNPSLIQRDGSSRKQHKGTSRGTEIQQTSVDTLGEDLAPRRVQLGLGEGTSGKDIIPR